MNMISIPKSTRTHGIFKAEENRGYVQVKVEIMKEAGVSENVENCIDVLKLTEYVWGH